MMRRVETLRLRAAPTALALIIGLAALMLPGRFGALTLAHALPSAPMPAPVVSECEGDACSHVSFDFDESKQQYRARNASQDRWVKVSASNLASSVSACLAPGKEQYLALKSLAGGYSAEFAEPKCGETMD